MSKVSIVGAYDSKFGNFAKKNKETGEVTDTASLYDLLVEAGRGALHVLYGAREKEMGAS